MGSDRYISANWAVHITALLPGPMPKRILCLVRCLRLFFFRCLWLAHLLFRVNSTSGSDFWLGLIGVG